MRNVHEILKPKFTAAAVLVLIVAMAISCATAGQPTQDKDPNATPEPTATPEIEYLVDSSGHRFAVEVHPEREGPIILEQSLESYALNHQATKEANQRSGKSIDPEPRPEVIIYVDSAARVEEIEQYLKQASITVISKTTEPSVSWPGALIANIPITKLLDLADQPGVLRIERILEGMPQSGNPQQEPDPTEWTIPPPPTSLPVKPVVSRNLQRMIARHTEEKANRRAAGENLPTVYVEIVVTVQGPEHVDALVEFMNEHATGWVSSNKYDGTNRNVNGTIARIDLDLVPNVEAMPGVIEIYEVIPASPASQLQQGVPTLLENGYPIVLRNRHRGHKYEL